MVGVFEKGAEKEGARSRSALPLSECQRGKKGQENCYALGWMEQCSVTSGAMLLSCWSYALKGLEQCFGTAGAMCWGCRSRALGSQEQCAGITISLPLFLHYQFYGSDQTSREQWGVGTIEIGWCIGVLRLAVGLLIVNDAVRPRINNAHLQLVLAWSQRLGDIHPVKLLPQDAQRLPIDDDFCQAGVLA